MKTILAKSLIFSFFIALIASGSCRAQEIAHWNTDYAKALAQAKTESRPLLLDFTGSDWCGWCMKFEKEVLKTKEFKDYAAKNLVLVVVDFPQAKFQSKKLKDQNAQLQTQFKVKGYPHFVLISKDGTELGQAGYLEGGPSAFIAKLEGFKK